MNRRLGGMVLGLAAACGRPAPTAHPAPIAVDAGRDAPTPPPDPAMADVIRELTAQHDRMCGCRDRACVDAAEADTTQWALDHKSLLDQTRPTPAQDTLAHDLVEATERCAEQVLAGPE